MLGNDVVDLRDAESRPESFRPRFDERVFTPEERRAIARDPQPLIRRWAHWAAKEAAFKLGKQLDPGFVFAPGRLEVRFDSRAPGTGRRLAQRGVVEWIGASERTAPGMIEVRSFETQDCVHLIALPAGADWGAVVFALEALETATTDPGASVRRLAVREIARSLGVESHRLCIGRRASSDSDRPRGAKSATGLPSRVPSVVLDGVETSLALSLSHHGRWIGFAMTPRIEAVIVANPRRELGSGPVPAGATTS
jgi:hypothetical protein